MRRVWGSRAGVVILSVALAQGCTKVAEVHPHELVRLSGHRPGRPPVRVHTVDGARVDIDGDFKIARIVTGDESHERVLVLRPPFVIESDTGALRYRDARATVGSVYEDRITRAEVLQHDESRTLVVLLATAAGAAAGLGLAFAAARAVAGANRGSGGDNPGDGALAAGGGLVVGGGIALLIAIPATSHY